MSESRLRADLRLPNTVQTVPTARRVLDQILSAWDLAYFSEDACLVLTELLTNAIRHDDNPSNADNVCVNVRSDGAGHLRLTVDDGTAALPVDHQLTDDEEGGRGLHIVQALATRWGATARSNGSKRVWAEFGAPTTLPVRLRTAPFGDIRRRTRELTFPRSARRQLPNNGLTVLPGGDAQQPRPQSRTSGTLSGSPRSPSFTAVRDASNHDAANRAASTHNERRRPTTTTR